jgi:hypothetical protein
MTLDIENIRIEDIKENIEGLNEEFEEMSTSDFRLRRPSFN